MTAEPAPAQPPKPPAEPRPAPTPVRRLLVPYAYLSFYYGALALIVAVLALSNPTLLAFAPIGGAADFSAVGTTTFDRVDLNAPAMDSTLTEGVKLALAIAASFALMLPVTWVCMGARRRKDVSQSFVQTILVLPIIITGIVHVVHNSLALAFSLAGIVAGVRFRHTLKDSAETTYLFTSIAVGVACGINAVEIAAVVSIFFNYTIIGLWATEYGSASTGKQMFSREWMSGEPEDREKEKRDKKEKNRADDDDDD